MVLLLALLVRMSECPEHQESDAQPKPFLVSSLLCGSGGGFAGPGVSMPGCPEDRNRMSRCPNRNSFKFPLCSVVLLVVWVVWMSGVPEIGSPDVLTEALLSF